MEMMKAVVYNKKGTPERLSYCEVEKPIPNDNELLIKIVAVSINAADYRSMNFGIIPKRHIFGADIAGKVESIGKNIEQFKPGDEVIGDLASFGFGGFAEYAVAPEKALIHKPAKISFEESAAFPMAGLTALQALRDKGKIKKGQKILIVGSGGGVGTFAVQIAKYFGAEVTAVCSSKNIEQTVRLGADIVIDYNKEDFTKVTELFDIILAINGSGSLSDYKRLLNRNGCYIMVGGALPQIIKSLIFGSIMSLGSKRMTSLAAKANQKDLGFIAKLIGEGKIKPLIEKLYTLEETAEAIAYAAKGHVQGKLVIRIN